MPRMMSGPEVGDLGLVQEINRLLLHPMGFALAYYEGAKLGSNAYYALEMLDYRETDDGEGVIFPDEDLDPIKMRQVRDMFMSRIEKRTKVLRRHIQPIQGTDQERQIMVVSIGGSMLPPVGSER